MPADISQLNMPFSDDFAVLLGPVNVIAMDLRHLSLSGLKRSMIDDGRSDISERERMNLLCSGYVDSSSLRYHTTPDTICQLPRLFMEHEEQQDIIWGRFCALYLPATVDRYTNLPPNIGSDPFTASFKIHNPCSEMLVQVLASLPTILSVPRKNQT